MKKHEALQIALEEFQRQASSYRLGKRDWVRHTEVMVAIEEALASPVQTPIGYLFKDEETGRIMVVPTASDNDLIRLLNPPAPDCKEQQ